MRIPTNVVQEIVDNNGCRKGSFSPISPTGIVRLALDLIDARKSLEEQRIPFLIKTLVTVAKRRGRSLDALLVDIRRAWPETTEEKTQRESAEDHRRYIQGLPPLYRG